MRHQRLDLIGKLNKTDATPQGGIRTPAFLTRVGVFVYTDARGNVTSRELRCAEEVFSQDSLDSLAAAPLVIGHPAKIDPGNWKEFAVGHVGEDVHQDGIYVAATVRIQDAATVAKCQSKGDDRLTELSCGYDCEVVPDSGTFEGEKYDSRQINIRYNHLGLGPSEWGRAGSEVRLRMDSVGEAAAIAVAPISTLQNVTIKSDEVVTPPAPVNVSINLAEVETLRGKIAALEAQNATLTAAQAPEVLDSKINARIKLHADACKVLGSVELTGKSDREVMVATVIAASPDFKADGKSDDFLRGMFEACVSTAGAATAALGAIQVAKKDAAPPPSGMAEAIERNKKRNAEAFKKVS